ncbi:MAG: hypothetical protein ACKOHG_09665 [Planctomycetia bacterium]
MTPAGGGRYQQSGRCGPAVAASSPEFVSRSHSAIRDAPSYRLSVLRVGRNNRYAEGWDQVFGGTKPGRAKAGKAKAATTKKAAKKSAKSSKPAATKKPAKKTAKKTAKKR